jgi:hypothetical protein
MSAARPLPRHSLGGAKHEGFSIGVARRLPQGVQAAARNTEVSQ